MDTFRKGRTCWGAPARRRGRNSELLVARQMWPEAQVTSRSILAGRS